MPKSSARVLLVAAMFGVVSPGCGSGRKLTSVSISPATADAQNFPNGQVQFTATGTYSSAPTTAQLTSSDITWCAGTSNGMCAGLVNPGATVDSNGLASCLPLFTGTANILAGVPGKASGIPDTGFPLTVYGSAQLTCP